MVNKNTTFEKNDLVFVKKKIWATIILVQLCITAISQVKPDSVFYDNGILKAVGFTKQALKDSIWIYYDQTGQIQKKGIYNLGLKTGEWEYFLPDTVLSHSIWYRNDTLVKKKNYLHKNGSFEIFDTEQKTKNLHY